MWRKFYDLARLVLTMSQQFQRQQQSIETLEEQVKQLTAAVQQLYFEMRRMQDEFRHAQDNERHEREILLLKLENELLKQGRHLPPPAEDTRPAS